MNTIRSVICLLLIAVVSSLKAQEEISIGKKYTIQSTVLEQDRELLISLPEGYEGSDKEYPVLYILDGQWHFTNGVAIQKSLRVPDRLPEMIVVGIVNANPLRNTLFWEEREKFLSFMENEVFSFVEENFRATKERVLFGWEMGGYFATYAFLHEKQLFNAAVATNGSYATEEMVDAFKGLDSQEKKYLYIVNSTKDIYSINSSNDLSQMLEEKDPDNLMWKYEQFNDEIHESLAYLALYHGLNYYYHDFQSLVFGSIQEYKDAGGIPYLEAYHRKRGERYGFPTEIDNSIKNSLIWLAWNRDDFESFSYFMEEFEEVLSTPRYASAYWQNRLAQFYLKHNDADNAIRFFNTGITTYSDDPRLAEMHHGLGKAYLLTSDKKLARKHLKRAVGIAEQTSNPDLDSYKAKLDELK